MDMGKGTSRELIPLNTSTALFRVACFLSFGSGERTRRPKEPRRCFGEKRSLEEFHESNVARSSMQFRFLAFLSPAILNGIVLKSHLCIIFSRTRRETFLFFLLFHRVREYLSMLERKRFEKIRLKFETFPAFFAVANARIDGGKAGIIRRQNVI